MTSFIDTPITTGLRPKCIDIKNSPLSDADDAGQLFVEDEQADGEEDDVEEEHAGPHHLGHAPLVGGDQDDDEDEHAKEQEDGAEHALAVHRRRLPKDARPQ